MTGIICAMDIEAEGLIRLMEDRSEYLIAGHKFVSGTVKGKDVVVAKNGIGKVNAASVTTVLITKFGVSEIINLGICGGIEPALTMIAASSVVQYDFDTTVFGDELGQLDGFPDPYIPCSETMNAKLPHDVCGVIASGDRFIADDKTRNFLKEKFHAVGFDMESGAIAQVCVIANVPVAILRTVSDGGSVEEYESFKRKAAARGVDAIIKYLECI